MSSARDTPNFYMPYDSNDDTGDDTGDETGDDTGDDTDPDEYNNQLDNQAPLSQLNREVRRQDAQIRKGFDPRILREYDPRYAIHATAGPNLPTQQERLKYREKESWGEWNSDTNVTSLAGYTYESPPKTTKTSLISIKSSNRDFQVYPSPYRFQIKLPRVYKKVTKFQFIQLSFPKANNTLGIDGFVTSTLAAIFANAFLNKGVSSVCISTCLQVINCSAGANTVGLMEQGRTASDGTPVFLTLSAPDGAYTDPQLAEELTFRANSTPPLNLISYPSFRDIFMNTRDISVLFNEPGDSFYSKANSQRYGMHTKDHIMNTYYTQYHIDRFPEISEQVAFVAYYFPILKELIATQRAQTFIETNGIPYSDVTIAVMGPFQGLDHPLYFALCETNQYVLDSYRKNLTFELRNINKYNITYLSQQSRFSIIHDTLHPSLSRDLTKNQQTILNQELSVHGLNTNSFKTLKTNTIGYTSILKHLEGNLSSVLGTYHFATGYRYSGGREHHTNEGIFDAISDLHEDSDFTSMFQYTSTIGRIYGNYGGLRMAFTNFLDYHSTLSSYYQIVQSTNNVIQTIHQNSREEFHSYVSMKYMGILPYNMIENQTYVSNQGLPVSFVTDQHVYFPGIHPSQLLPPAESVNMYNVDDDPNSCSRYCCEEIQKLVFSWYSCIPVNTINQTLGYRLGISIFQNPFSIVSTFTEVISTAFTNYLISINDEQGFNNMDISMNENYRIGNETTGQVKYICAKVLMANVDNSNVSQTLIQNPVIFDQPLGKLDRLNFKIYFDDDAVTPAWLFVPPYLDINEWNATFQIDEEIGYASVDAGWSEKPTVPIPEQPSQMPFIFLKPDPALQKLTFEQKQQERLRRNNARNTTSSGASALAEETDAEKAAEFAASQRRAQANAQANVPDNTPDNTPTNTAPPSTAPPSTAPPRTAPPSTAPTNTGPISKIANTPK
jgi:hypothetical protein